MSLHAQTLLAQAQQEIRAFKGAAEYALIREKGKCLRQHLAQQHKQIDALSLIHI